MSASVLKQSATNAEDSLRDSRSFRRSTSIVSIPHDRPNNIKARKTKGRLRPTRDPEQKQAKQAVDSPQRRSGCILPDVSGHKEKVWESKRRSASTVELWSALCPYMNAGGESNPESARVIALQQLIDQQMVIPAYARIPGNATVNAPHLLLDIMEIHPKKPQVKASFPLGPTFRTPERKVLELPAPKQTQKRQLRVRGPVRVNKPCIFAPHIVFTVCKNKAAVHQVRLNAKRNSVPLLPPGHNPRSSSLEHTTQKTFSSATPVQELSKENTIPFIPKRTGTLAVPLPYVKANKAGRNNRPTFDPIICAHSIREQPSKAMSEKPKTKSIIQPSFKTCADTHHDEARADEDVVSWHPSPWNNPDSRPSTLMSHEDNSLVDAV